MKNQATSSEERVAKLTVNSCTVIRRMLVERGTLTFSGEKETLGFQWEERPCNAPLFSDEDREAGQCRSCASGWTHENNYPVTREVAK